MEKQEAVQVFRELYLAVVSSLKIVSRWPGEGGNKAAAFSRALDGSFLVAQEILQTIVGLQVRLLYDISGYVLQLPAVIEKKCLHLGNKL